MSDVGLVQRYFNVSPEEAKSMIDKGINIDYLRDGFKDYLPGEIDKVGKKFQSKVDSLVKDELSSSI
jgi:hypothetical protein